MAKEQTELLFFDTFSHESSEELNLDLVQFTKTVCVTEIRVIPLGARVQADFPGGVRLGATNPSQFQIEFFVNDLSKPGASTFESVGGMEYNQNGNIHVSCEQKIPTDGLVLRGWYTTITLAVYGYLTKAVIHETAPATPVSSQPDIGADTTADWVQHHTQVNEVPPEGYPPRVPYVPRPYAEESYPPDYPSHPHPYQEEWAQPAEGYEVPKEAYEGDGMMWEQRTPEDKPAWERKDRDRDLHHRAEPDFREHVRECSPEYERTRGQRGDYHYPRGPPHHRGWAGRPRTPPAPPIIVEEPIIRASASPDLTSIKKETTSPTVAFESLSPGDVESISEGEIPEAEGESELVEAPEPVNQPTPPATSPSVQPPTEEQRMDIEPFEPILSDEEIADDGDQQFQDMDYDFTEYPDDPLRTFNPYNFELQPLVVLSDPAVVRTAEALPSLSTLLASVSTALVSSAAREEWVHAAEQLLTLLHTRPDLSGVIDTIVSWVDIGLDFQEALNQPQPGYKLRHIKAGVRLVEAVCQCGEEATNQLMNKINVHKKLIDMYHQEYMALSIKLMILNSLDASLRYKRPVESFITGKDWNGYNKLLEMIKIKQLARLQFSLKSLLQKLHFYELLDTLNKTVSAFSEETGDNRTAVTEIDVEHISNTLEEIIKIHHEAPMLISQPKRFLPVSAQFEINCGSYPDPYPALYTYFRTHQLHETLLTLLTHPRTSCHPSIVIPVHEVIASLQDTEDGLRFLAAVPHRISALVRVLLGSSSAEDTEDTTPESHSQLGLHLAYRLQALCHVDNLMKYSQNLKCDPDDPEVFEHLQSLFCLTFGAVGKMSVVHVLSQGSHLAVLIKYLKDTTTKKDSKVKRFPGKSFVADLITMTIKYSSQVLYLQKYAKELLDVISSDTSLELNDLMAWLKPVESPSAFAYDDISDLIEILKKNIDNATTFPGELITVVRLLVFLGIPPHNKDLRVFPDSFEYVELKYKSVIIQLFSLDGTSYLSAIIQKLCEHYEQPALHASKLVGRQGLALVSFLGPAMQLIRVVLTNVIKCRNTEFKDLTMIPVLLQAYSLLQALPVAAHAHHEAQKVCRDIVETLLAYTQPVSSDPTSETEALNKSLWTLMMSEVLKYAVSTPNNFLPGLSLISELLPLPLQMQTREPLGKEEVMRIVNCRKLWSAHLHCLGSLISDVVSTICSSSYSPLLQLLRSVCVQLADLAAPTATMVTKAVLDMIVKAVTPAERPVSSHMMRLLTFLACLATHASVKIALLHLLTRHAGTDKTQQQYPDLVISLCHILRAPHPCPTHIQAQECIISVVQSLCHCELTVVPPPAAGSSIEVYLANTLPSRDLLGTLILVMLEHVADSRNSLTTLQPSLRTFLMLTEYDYGFFHLRNCLEKKTDALCNVVSKVVSVWMTERADCVATMNTLLELLRGCLTPDAPDEVLGLPARTITLTAPELANILNWERNTEDKKHPLYAIDTLLQESRAEDESLETLCENITELIRLLEEDGSKPLEPKDVSEPLLPPSDSLLAQFAVRPLCVVGEVEDDRLTAAYWLSVPLPDDQDSEMQQQVSVDLVEVAHAELPELPLAEHVATLCRHKTTPGDLAPTSDKRVATDTNTRRPFIAPMRGRGFRGAVQRGDMFRSRPPNTSRPPSLHVDDFVALETCGAQPTGPTGYNKLSMRAAQDIIATRNRGRPRPFGVDRGGRFFPTPYARRENGAGREGHWHGEGSGGGSGPGGNNFHPPPPSDASHFPRPLPAPHHWSKEGRERFLSPSMRGGPPHRGEPNRHMRFFSR